MVRPVLLDANENLYKVFRMYLRLKHHLMIAELAEVEKSIPTEKPEVKWADKFTWSKLEKLLFQSNCKILYILQHHLEWKPMIIWNACIRSPILDLSSIFLVRESQSRTHTLSLSLLSLMVVVKWHRVSLSHGASAQSFLVNLHLGEVSISLLVVGLLFCRETPWKTDLKPFPMASAWHSAFSLSLSL